MAEIKSTLDLVLEKTRHLTLSEEEKRQQKNMEARNRLAGLLQRYQDSILDINKLGEELDRLVQAGDGPDESMVRDEVMERIELGRDNRHWLQLLQARYRLDTSGVQKMEEGFRHAVEEAAGRREAEIRAELERDRHISGSAVAPHLDADHNWGTVRQAIAADFQPRLASELSEMKNRPV